MILLGDMEAGAPLEQVLAPIMGITSIWWIPAPEDRLCRSCKLRGRITRRARPRVHRDDSAIRTFTYYWARPATAKLNFFGKLRRFLSMHLPANLEGILAQAGAATVVVNESGIVLFATDQACRTLKYAPGELNGLSVERLMPERFRLAHIGHRLRFTDDLRTRPMGTGLELFALCKDGSELRVDLSLKPVQSGLNTLIVVKIEMRELSQSAP